MTGGVGGPKLHKSKDNATATGKPKPVTGPNAPHGRHGHLSAGTAQQANKMAAVNKGLVAGASPVNPQGVSTRGPRAGKKGTAPQNKQVVQAQNPNAAVNPNTANTSSLQKDIARRRYGMWQNPNSKLVGRTPLPAAGQGNLANLLGVRLPGRKASSPANATNVPNVSTPGQRSTSPSQSTNNLRNANQPRQSAATTSASLTTNDKTRPEAGERLSKAEKTERSRIYSPQDGVGFAFGKDKPATGEIERWQAGLTDRERSALKDPNTRIVITAGASRVGGQDFNAQLTDRRAVNVQQELVETFGVNPGSIDINSLYRGEELAIQKGKPDHKDNAEDRTATIQVFSGGQNANRATAADKPSVQDAVDSLTQGLSRPEQKDLSKQRALDQLKIGKDFVVFAVSGNLWKGLSAGFKEIGWMGKEMVRDMTDAKVILNMGTQFNPAFMGRICEWAGVPKKDAYQSSILDNKYSAWGRQVADRVWNNLSDQEQANIVTTMHSDARDKFEKQLSTYLHDFYASRNMTYTNW